MDLPCPVDTPVVLPTKYLNLKYTLNIRKTSDILLNYNYKMNVRKVVDRNTIKFF